ncbi:response regulator [Maribacter algarum]|uniref:Response regulator n=1 Tax=Maribacter algarum (ex Zhang et al. 2020) TaxID=2578118 RepID=A0A5S3QI74_9FLAO|nr:response regulator [Maribacter algarum]TMM57245.1 response regulator [Maribacter algarum]
MNSPNLNSILLVDDDEISNLFNKIFIGKLNLNVDVDFVLNGREALDLLIPSEEYTTVLMPCLLLLDIKMPLMDGWQFLEAYEEQVSAEIKDEITIIMLTTSKNEGDKIKAMKNPIIKEFIQKPLSEKALRTLVAKYFPASK